MKKVIIITAVLLVIAVALVVGLTVGASDNDIVYSPAPISQELRNQLDADFARIFIDSYTPEWYTEAFPYDNCRIYGEENGYFLFFFTGGMRMATVVTENIGGVEFYNPMPFSLYAYKDGVFINIEYAYEQGLISKEALLKAQEYHNQCLVEKERWFG